jgi:DNA-binding LacI/PurR family transcriptional regulator
VDWVKTKRFKLSRAVNVGIVNLAGQSAMLRGHFYSRIWSGMFAEAGLDYHRVVALQFSVDNVRQQMTEAISEFKLEGVIIVGIGDRDFVEAVISTNLSVVVADHHFDDLHVDCVDLDSRSSTVAAVKRLAQEGHQRICFMDTVNPEENPWKLEGFKIGMEGAGLQFDESLLLRARASEGGGRECTQMLLESGKTLPTAIVSYSAPVAMGVLAELNKQGIDVPEAISVISCGQTFFANMNKHLSMVAVNAHEVGIRAMRTLVERIVMPDRPHCVYLIAPEMQVGSTVGPCTSGN